MANHHKHEHAHSEPGNHQGSVERVNRRPLAIALVITVGFLVIEVLGALLTNSPALLADAGHSERSPRQ